MHNTSKLLHSRALAESSDSGYEPRAFPAWIDASEFGLPHACAVPRVRDSLVLRLVAGRRRERIASPLNATGAH